MFWNMRLELSWWWRWWWCCSSCDTVSEEHTVFISGLKETVCFVKCWYLPTNYMALQVRTTTLFSSEILIATTKPSRSQSTFLLPWKLKSYSFWSSWLSEKTSNLLSSSETGVTHWWWTQSLKLWDFLPYWHADHLRALRASYSSLLKESFICIEMHHYFFKIYIGHFFRVYVRCLSHFTHFVYKQ
jgi:hypothetical protein